MLTDPLDSDSTNSDARGDGEWGGETEREDIPLRSLYQNMLCMHRQIPSFFWPVGWQYVAAPKNNRSQNYKTGKFLLEQVKTTFLKNEGFRTRVSEQ